MTPRQLITKAALLLDHRNDSVGAEQALRQAVELSVQGSDQSASIEATAFLAELLAHQSRDTEALSLFETIIAIAANNTEIERDLIEPHLRTAQEYVANARGRA